MIDDGSKSYGAKPAPSQSMRRERRGHLKLTQVTYAKHNLYRLRFVSCPCSYTCLAG